MIENADIPSQISCARARIPAESSFSIQPDDLASLIFEEQSQRDRSAKGNGRLTPNHPSTGPEMREQAGWQSDHGPRQADESLCQSQGEFRYGLGCEPSLASLRPSTWAKACSTVRIWLALSAPKRRTNFTA